MKLFHAISNYMSGLWDTTLEPWLESLGKNVLHDAVTVAYPLAVQAVSEFATAGAGITGDQAGQILSSTASKIAAAGLDIAIHDTATAVAAALASAKP